MHRQLLNVAGVLFFAGITALIPIALVRWILKLYFAKGD